MNSKKTKRKLFGHPMFYELLKEEKDLYSRKNRDYANDGDYMRNFRSVAKMARGLVTPGNEDTKVALIYLLKQLDAAINLISENREGGVEGVIDRLRDMGVYSKLTMILYKEGVMKQKKGCLESKIKTLYLAHPFDSREEIREWELGFEKRTNINLLNPFYDCERTDIISIDAGRQERYQVDPTEIVINDISQISNKGTDGLVAIIDGSLSYGTIQEMVYGNKIYNKPVYSIITNKHEKHPWLNFHSTKVFTSMKEFEDYALKNFNK